MGWMGGASRTAGVDIVHTHIAGCVFAGTYKRSESRVRETARPRRNYRQRNRDAFVDSFAFSTEGRGWWDLLCLPQVPAN